MVDAEGAAVKPGRVGDLPNKVDGEQRLDAEITETMRDVPVPGLTSHAAAPTREDSDHELFRDAEPAVQIVPQQGVFRNAVPTPTVPATPAAQKLLQHAIDHSWSVRQFFSNSCLLYTSPSPRD